VNKPNPNALILWRGLHFAAAFFAAVLISVLFTPGSASWIFAISVLSLLFLAAYLFYLPLLFRRISFFIKNDKIIYSTGVLFRREIAVPVNAIQYTTVAQNAFAKSLGLSSLVITMAGGKLIIPGLNTSEAEKLAETLKP
jgi:membrane protein YdbS with pleckstrin-like domain